MLLESARVHYESTRETQLLSKQIFQCQMIGRIEKLFRSDSDSGTFIAAGALTVLSRCSCPAKR